MPLCQNAALAMERNTVMEEIERVESLSNWYHTEELNFDKRLIHFRYKTLLPHLQGPEGLELGPAQGEMTQYLVDHFQHLTVVDGASNLLKSIPNKSNLTKIHSLFENYIPTKKFNTIIMEHILEHIENPVELLLRIRDWLAPNGKILIGVPNGLSIHRLVAVKMKLLANPCELNSRDHALGHRRVYTPTTLRSDIENAGLHLHEIGGVFFKPVSNGQIEQSWTDEMINGFYELGKDFPENAAELYVVCSNPS